MESTVARDMVVPFTAPRSSLGDLKADVAAQLIATAADIALVLDRDGIIRDVAFGNEELTREGAGEWLGRRWVETVTVESRPKIEQLLGDALSSQPPRWRQVNHPSPAGPDLPVRYSAMQLGRAGRVVAIGRDLRALAALQQRLVNAQQSMEREYARLRHAETRYRLLFQIASEAVLIVDAASQKVVDVNPAAGRLIARTAGQVIGRPVAALFDGRSGQALQEMLSTARVVGRAEDVVARLAESEHSLRVSASLFRQENSAHFLVRLLPPQAETAAEGGVPRPDSRLLSVVESSPDAFVVTDPQRRILTVNPAFLELAQIATEEQVRGEPLERWLGRTEVDLNVLMASLREHGSVRHFGTVLRGEFGAAEEVEVSAVSVTDAEEPCIGFMLRSVGARAAPEPRGIRDLPRSVEQLTGLIGRVSLKDIVRETTDVIERLSIEAALELTGDNRASAAQMLGLSRQSLYSKLRRYGLGDLGPDPER